MKRKILALCGAAAMSALLVGCALYSLKPYYTEANRVPVPTAMAGLWKQDAMTVQIKSDGQVTIRQFSSNDGENTEFVTPATVVFFQIGDQLYADLTLTNLPGKTLRDSVAAWMLLPTHNLYRVKLDGDRLEVRWPDLESYRAAWHDGRLKLPATQVKDVPVFTADGEEWDSLLRNPEQEALIFPPQNKPVTLTRELI